MAVKSEAAESLVNFGYLLLVSGGSARTRSVAAADRSTAGGRTQRATDTAHHRSRLPCAGRSRPLGDNSQPNEPAGRGSACQRSTAAAAWRRSASCASSRSNPLRMRNPSAFSRSLGVSGGIGVAAREQRGRGGELVVIAGRERGGDVVALDAELAQAPLDPIGAPPVQVAPVLGEAGGVARVVDVPAGHELVEHLVDQRRLDVVALQPRPDLRLGALTPGEKAPGRVERLLAELELGRGGRLGGERAERLGRQRVERELRVRRRGRAKRRGGGRRWRGRAKRSAAARGRRGRVAKWRRQGRAERPRRRWWAGLRRRGTRRRGCPGGRRRARPPCRRRARPAGLRGRCDPAPRRCPCLSPRR